MAIQEVTFTLNTTLDEFKGTLYDVTEVGFNDWLERLDGCPPEQFPSTFLYPASESGQRRTKGGAVVLDLPICDHEVRDGATRVKVRSDAHGQRVAGASFKAVQRLSKLRVTATCHYPEVQADFERLLSVLVKEYPEARPAIEAYLGAGEGTHRPDGSDVEQTERRKGGASRLEERPDWPTKVEMVRRIDSRIAKGALVEAACQLENTTPRTYRRIRQRLTAIGQ